MYSRSWKNVQGRQACAGWGLWKAWEHMPEKGGPSVADRPQPVVICSALLMGCHRSNQPSLVGQSFSMDLYVQHAQMHGHTSTLSPRVLEVT